MAARGRPWEPLPVARLLPLCLLLGCAHGVLEGRAAPLRSVDLADGAWEDLAPLERWVGDARVVMLGESHGDGTSLLAMGRVVRFLHERLGFDLLAFESGFLDMEAVDEALGGTAPLTEVAELGLHAPWSEVAETRPLLAYLRSTRGTARPMRVAGVDLQPTGLKADLAGAEARLERGLGACGVSPSPGERACLHQALAVRALADRPCLEPTVAGLLARATGEVEACGWTRQALRNLAADGRLSSTFARARAKAERPEQLLEVLMRDSPWLASFRDERMAENLLWLLERAPGARVVVWAARVHVSRGKVGDPAQGRLVPPMGAHVADRLGPALRTLACTWYQGEAGVPWVGTSGGTEEEGTLEALLHATGRPLWFVDTRGPWPAEPPGGLGEPRRWSSTHDGVLFIDRMTPSSWAEGAALRQAP